MKSRFKISIVIPLSILILNSTLLFVILNNAFHKISSSPILIFILVLLIFFLIMISFGEIRLKIISINIDKNKIEIKRYFGLRKIISINDNEINGFYSSLIMTKNGAYDCIYLMKENKKIAKISNQYHKNFNELSIEIKKKYKDLGFVKSGFTSEIKDIFN